nr:hypothetical protein [Deltaproteobacteria bacterium]
MSASNALDAYQGSATATRTAMAVRLAAQWVWCLGCCMALAGTLHKIGGIFG